jgi:hypothetical protein
MDEPRVDDLLGGPMDEPRVDDLLCEPMDEPCVDDLLCGPMDEPHVADYIRKCVDIPQNAGGPVCDPRIHIKEAKYNLKFPQTLSITNLIVVLHPGPLSLKSIQRRIG